VDITSHNKSVAISGFISVEGALCLDQEIVTRIGTPESFSLFVDFMQTIDVDAFQRSALSFISWLSDKVSPDLARMILEGFILVPRALAIKSTCRTQNTDAMLKKARAGELELLLITGAKDRLMNIEAVKAVYQETEWKKYVHKHFEDGDHMPWISIPDQFRLCVLQWIGERRNRR
jgi:pimeloyl-ACP methyl ester carboxylesterase